MCVCVGVSSVMLPTICSHDYGTSCSTIKGNLRLTMPIRALFGLCAK